MAAGACSCAAAVLVGHGCRSARLRLDDDGWRSLVYVPRPRLSVLAVRRSAGLSLELALVPRPRLPWLFVCLPPAASLTGARSCAVSDASSPPRRHALVFLCRLLFTKRPSVNQPRQRAPAKCTVALRRCLMLTLLRRLMLVCRPWQNVHHLRTLRCCSSSIFSCA